MNYVWEPTEGMRKMKNWPPEEYVVQMLRTRGGLILIGGKSAFFFRNKSVNRRVDSISQQHSHAMGYGGYPIRP